MLLFLHSEFCMCLMSILDQCISYKMLLKEGCSTSVKAAGDWTC